MEGFMLDSSQGHQGLEWPGVPPFRAARRLWWEYRKPIDHERLMYTLLHAGGGRSIYMVTLPYS
jgi:hypothetical protein